MFALPGQPADFNVLARTGSLTPKHPTRKHPKPKPDHLVSSSAKLTLTTLASKHGPSSKRLLGFYCFRRQTSTPNSSRCRCSHSQPLPSLWIPRGKYPNHRNFASTLTESCTEPPRPPPECRPMRCWIQHRLMPPQVQREKRSSWTRVGNVTGPCCQAA